MNPFAKDAQKLKFIREDPGFCRVLYRGSVDRVIYAIHNAGRFGEDDYCFYQCTKDGEASWECAFPIKSRFNKFILPRSHKSER